MMTATFMPLVLLGVLSALCYAGLWIGAGPDGPSVPHFLGVTAVAFLLYGVACRVAQRSPTRTALVIIIGGAVVFRLLMAGRVILDDDIYRYHWDGKVLASGINPYRYAPDDPVLVDLRDENWERIGYPYVKTIYAPLTEALCAASYLVWPSPARIRVLAALFDLATLAPILLILRRLKLPETLVIIYAWNPLPIKEFANSGHLDSMAIFFLMASICLIVEVSAKTGDRHLFRIRNRCLSPVFAGAIWGLSVLSKPWTLLLWPLYADRRRAIGIVAMAAVVMIGAAPFLGAGMSLVEGSRVYAEHWEFNSGLFALEQAAFGRQAAKALGALLWLGVAWPVMRAKGEDGAEVLRRAGLLIGVALLLSPVCNPWYVCWLLPLLCVHRSPAALAFTGLVMLSYAYYIEPVGEFDPAARVIEYGLLGLLLVWEGVSRDRQSLWEGLLASSGRP